MVAVRNIIGKFLLLQNQVCCGALVVMLRQDSLLYCLAHADAKIELVLAKAAHQGIFFYEKSVVLQLLKGRL